MKKDVSYQERSKGEGGGGGKLVVAPSAHPLKTRPRPKKKKRKLSGAPNVVAVVVIIWRSGCVEAVCVCVCVDWVRDGVVVAAAAGRLLHEVGHQEGGDHRQAGDAEHGSRVALVLEALAHVGVVFFQDGGVAVALLILLPPAATDHTLIATHILVDLPAEIFFAIIGARLDKFSGFGLVFVALEKEGVSALGVLVAVADVAVDTRPCGKDGQDDEEGGADDKFRVHDAVEEEEAAGAVSESAAVAGWTTPM